MNIPEGVIEHLNYMAKTYDGFNKMLTEMKNRLHALNKDARPKDQEEIDGLEKIKSALSRRISKELEYWPIWTEWLVNVPGVGPAIGANLILLYYYRFAPACPVCGTVVEKTEGTFFCPACEKSIKGDGVAYEIQERDFPNVSKWWAFMGRKIEDGKMTKRAKGKVQTWSSKGRLVGFQVGDQFNRRKDSDYGRFLLERKAHREKTHPDATKGHRLNMARNEAVKLFLSHFWHVARTLDGKSTAGPYAEVVMGHTGIIPPFYWDEGKREAA